MGLQFNLLRCSTNLKGPTDNFRDTDKEIIGKVNNIVKYYFRDAVELNHVLAQVYENTMTINNNGKKERKAKISKHSDKTKDMPKNALIAFCSFYKDYYNGKINNVELKSKKSNNDQYDICYKGTSMLTILRFILKKEVVNDKLAKNFDVVLYPNSVFIIPLSTNRLYTHEIVPSMYQQIKSLQDWVM